VCPECRRAAVVTREELEESGLDASLGQTHEFFEGAGCIECGGTGYRGRTALCELLDVTDEVRELILAKAPASAIKEAMRAEGVRLLRECAVEKLLSGLTTLKEINKVTFVS